MFICSNDWLSKTLLRISILVWSFPLYLNKQFAPRGGDMGMQGKMLQSFAMQTLVPNAALGIKFSRDTGFFSLVLVYPGTGYMLREVKSHSWVCCWILVVFIFACYHADKSQQPIIHFVFRREFLWKSQPCCRILTPKQMAQTQTVLFECDNQSKWSYESVLDEVQMNGLSQRLVSATWYPLIIVLLNSFFSYVTH